MDLDTRTFRSIYTIKKQNHGDTVSSTLQLQSTEHNNIRRQYERPGRNTLAGTAQWRTKTDSICKQISFGYRKEIRHQRTRIIGGRMWPRTLPFTYIR